MLLQAASYYALRKPAWLFLLCFSVSRHHDRHAWGLLPSAPKTCPPTPCTCLPVLTMHKKAASNCGNRSVEEALSTADPMLNRFNADCQGALQQQCVLCCGT